MKEELRKYLKETYHVTHKGFVKYFLLRTSGEAIPTNELANEVGCCYQSIENWDAMLMELGIIRQRGVKLFRYINGDRVAIDENDYEAYTIYSQIANLYRGLDGLLPYGIDVASNREDISSTGIVLADVFSNLQEALQNTFMSLVEGEITISIAPKYEVDTDNEVYINTMLKIARYSVL